MTRQPTRIEGQRDSGYESPAWRVLLLGALLAVLIALGSGTPARAAFGIADFDGSVSNADGTPATQAGAHPYQASTGFDVTTSLVEEGGHAGRLPDAAPKDVQVELPPGFIGDPLATPRCPAADYNDPAEFRTACPLDSIVGIAEVRLDVLGGISTEVVPVYNLVPPPGQPAQFGFSVLAVRVKLNATVRAGDYGITIDIANIAQGITLVGSTVTLWGEPAGPSHDIQRCRILDGFASPPICDGFEGPENVPHSSEALPKPFLTNPTDCSAGPLTTNLSADSWEEPGAFLHANFVSHDNSPTPVPVGLTGCERLPFNPTIAVTPESRVAGAPSGYTFDVKMPYDENPVGLAEAALKDATVTLPAGVSVSPSAAGGLGGCVPEEIGLGSSAAPSCPDSSKIGTVQIQSPLLEAPLSGSIYLAQQSNNPFGTLLAVYLVAEGEGVIVKLPGRVDADPTTGQLTASFQNNPQLPFTDLALAFKGGARAPLVNPASCGTYTTEASFTPYSGTATVSTSAPFTIDQGCTPPAFAPSFTAGTISPQAGRPSSFTVTFARSDADERLGAITVRTPPGLLGVLKSVVQCPEPQAAQGACGAGSLIGHTTVGAGAGTNPFYLGGQVFLTGPYKGAPFGLSIVVPAIAGPFNLGTVVVRAAIAVDPHTAALTITSDPLPTILQGIPLDIRTVNVTVDRAGFMFNPTNCDPLSVQASIVSTEGANAAVSNRFQAAGCESLVFKPKFTASLAGKSSRANGAALDVKISSGAGQANIGRVAVSLPRALPSRLSTIQKACPQATFAASPASCPVGSLVGSGTAVTPILAHALAGPAYLVSHGGAAFPDLVVVLRGEGITVDLTGAIDITKAGITSSTFANVPDVPISSFELKLPTGSHSALTANLPGSAKGSFCGQSLTMPTSITGQNGTVLKQSTKLTVSGCSAKPKAKATGKAKSGK